MIEDTPRPLQETIPETPDWLCAIITKLQAKNREERYQSAKEIADVMADCEAQLVAKAQLTDYSRIPTSKKPNGKTAGWQKQAGAVALLLPIVSLVLTEGARVTQVFRRQQPKTEQLALAPEVDSSVVVNRESSPAMPKVPSVKQILIGHTGAIRAVAYLPDGRILASGGRDAGLHLWDAESGKLLHDVPVPAGQNIFQGVTKKIPSGVSDAKVSGTVAGKLLALKIALCIIRLTP